jgi:hypothetical protein
MPSPVTDQTHWCHSTPGLRWARQPRKGLPRGKDSVDLIGHIASGLYGGSFDRRGASFKARYRPGSFYRANHIPNQRNIIWRLRPNRTSAKNWSPAATGQPPST